MPRKNSTDKLKGRRVQKGTPRTKPSAKESARANRVQDKPKGTRGTMPPKSSPASRPARQSNTGKMEGASGTRGAADKGKTAKKITNSRAAKTKSQLRATTKATGQPGQAAAKRAADAAAKRRAKVSTAKKVGKAALRLGSKAVAPVGLVTEGILAANKLADKRSPKLKAQVKSASASQKARRDKKKPKA